MHVDFVPLKEFSTRYAEGWRLANSLEKNDYAALMIAPSEVTRANNRSAAGTSRNNVRYGHASVADEVDQLRDKISLLTGRDQVERTMRRFAISKRKAEILLLLVKRGLASYEAIALVLYSDDERAEMESLEGAIRDHMKRLRPILGKHGLTIITSYGYGYEMSDAMRARARVLLDGTPCPK